MKTTNYLRAAIALIVMLAGSLARAVNVTWSSTSSQDWNTSANWTPASGTVRVPSGSDTALFAASAGLQTTVTFSSSPSALSALSLSGSGYTVGSTTDGHTLTLSNATPIAASNTSGTNTINENITLNISSSDNITQAGGGSLVLNGVISQGGAGTNISLGGTSGQGKITLAGLNTFTANVTIIDNGSVGGVIVSTIGDAGVAGNLGAGSVVSFGSVNSTGVLFYTGAGETTDRTFNLAAGGTGTGGATIDSSGSGALVLSAANFTVVSSTGSKTLTLTGTNTGANTIESTIVNSSGGGVTSLTKSGVGTWILSGSNSYTGKTAVSAGTLEFANAASLYNSTTPTAVLVTTSSGATTAFGVGGSGGFTSSQIDAINTALITGATSATGFRSGSTIGFDTTAGDFTYNTAIANAGSTGANVLGLAKLGSKNLILGGNNTYSGGTTISAGTLYANTTGSGNSSTGAGAVTVVGGALAGSGRIEPTGASGVTVNSAGSLAPGVNSVAGSGVAAPGQSVVPYLGTPGLAANGNLTLDTTNFTGGSVGQGTVAGGSSFVGALGTNTALLTVNSANLTFSLGAGNTSSALIVGGTAANTINFSGTSTVAINDLVGTGLTLNNEYALIQGNGSTIYSGLTVSSTLTAGLGYQIMGGLQLLAPTAGNFYSQWYGTSELFLNGDNIDVEVVPEPSSWAMMLGGLILLIVYQRGRKRAQSI